MTRSKGQNSKTPESPRRRAEVSPIEETLAELQRPMTAAELFGGTPDPEAEKRRRGLRQRVEEWMRRQAAQEPASAPDDEQKDAEKDRSDDSSA